MLMLYLDEERTMKPCRDKDGHMHILSVKTCEFIMAYALFCMGDAERSLCLRKKTPKFLEDD